MKKIKLKKTQFSTTLYKLFGDDYQTHLEVGREYWWYFASRDSGIANKYGNGWYKIKITYIRSGCLFYIFSDYPDIKENFCPVNCFMASTFVLAEIDPVKDLGESLGNIETAKYKYCFDDKLTIVKNWPNERKIEIDEDLLKKFNDDIDFLWLMTNRIDE